MERMDKIVFGGFVIVIIVGTLISISVSNLIIRHSLIGGLFLSLIFSVGGIEYRVRRAKAREAGV